MSSDIEIPLLQTRRRNSVEPVSEAMKVEWDLMMQLGKRTMLRRASWGAAGRGPRFGKKRVPAHGMRSRASMSRLAHWCLFEDPYSVRNSPAKRWSTKSPSARGRMWFDDAVGEADDVEKGVVGYSWTWAEVWQEGVSAHGIVRDSLAKRRSTKGPGARVVDVDAVCCEDVSFRFWMLWTIYYRRGISHAMVSLNDYAYQQSHMRALQGRKSPNEGKTILDLAASHLRSSGRDTYKHASMPQILLSFLCIEAPIG
ncbi:hypothetical protein EDD18DRAFT_1106052 [Armillaria luteobubalina]|uniref:Uncharacterized protein n=1 Tax=Armillaria luteobubalina TaxID=153913 RepID=A0AA39Q6F3_9AGAR|nr:hypothetical protein EDD18DRAFT_1106052 [Armillaria luteobubalina]